MKTPRQRLLCAVLALSALCGCATPPAIGPLPRGAAVSLQVTRSAPDGAEQRIRNQALSDNVSTGAGSGAVVGALYGLGCGPLAVLCVPLAAMLGGVTGTAAGAAVGLTGALSAQKTTQVLTRLNQVQEAHNLTAELDREVAERAGRQWALQSATPAYRLNLELQDLLISSTRDERIGFVLRVKVRVNAAGADRKADANERVFEYVAPAISLAEWIDEGSDVLDRSLSVASKQLALQIVSELTQR